LTWDLFKVDKKLRKPEKIKRLKERYLPRINKRLKQIESAKKK
jgi:hypothetical protein